MNWSAPLDLYCERTDPSYWAEPVNALTNAAFLIAALIAFLDWRRDGRLDWPVAVLIALVAVIGAGSFIFHTVATRGAALFDTIPIAVFIYGYLFFALRRFLQFTRPVALLLLIGFAAASYVEGLLVPAGALNGSHSYLPALAAMAIVGVLAMESREARYVLAAAAVFAASIVFRSIDNAVCAGFPLGTHFLWHVLNATVLYLLLRAALVSGGRQGPP